MNGKPATILAFAFTVALGGVALAAEETRQARQVRPSYPRDRAERQATPAPERRALPESLRIAVPRQPNAGDEIATRSGGAHRTRSGPTATPRHDELRSRAHEAAAWAAAEAIEHHGRPRYFEIGFHDGLHDAFRRASRDPWEHRQGRRSGRLDPQADALGEEIGEEEARAIAVAQASRLVGEQFRDLGREPVRLAPPPPPPFTASGFAVAEPLLRDVFADLSWRGRRGSGSRHARLDPWRLYQARGHGAFYRHDWRTGRKGLDLWCEPRRNARWLRGLDSGDRRHFEEWFTTAFEAELARRFAGVAERAFERGYDAGWRHGIRVGREWQFRRGYHQGFEAAVRERAGLTFARAFRPAWLAAYGLAFDGWATTVRLEAGLARLRDANDDGVFEPGEEIFAEVELVNFGGAAGRLDAALTGPALAEGERRAIEVARRSRVRPIAPLRARIRPSAAPAGDSLVTLSVGDLREPLPLRVSHVLRFERGLRVASLDALAGTAVVDVRLANASRRPVLANLDAGLRLATLEQPRRRLPAMPAGSSRSVRFRVRDAHPLDLVAGKLVLHVAAETEGRPQGTIEARLPELATDLGDASLVGYLVHLGRAGQGGTGSADLRRAHQLMLRRLEADWQAAVRADGNPYKADLRRATTLTALGELVAAARAERLSPADRAVFAGLVPGIDELSRSLPGTHPFLRRAMRKLARQLL